MIVIPGQELKKPLLEQFECTRDRTLELVRTLEKDDFMAQTESYTSPPKWHLGHVSWIYEAILYKIDGDYEFYSKEFSEYLNSYYQQFGVPKDKASRGTVSRPTLEQVFEYFDAVNRRVRDFIGTRRIGAREYKLITTGFHHECQHQELLVYDLQHMLGDRYAPARKNRRPAQPHVKNRQIAIGGGLYHAGYGGDGFCYDIELPEHRVYLDDYKIDSLPVTNGQYMEFMDDGGYGDYKFWLADGWEKLKENLWESPMYWEKADGRWFVADFAGKRRISPEDPVCHVSFYEASAYCKWAERRLPSEAEWEKAALWSEQKQRKLLFPWGDKMPDAGTANLLESYQWGCTPAGSYPEGRSPSGCHQMIGDVWEWTSSEFAGYPKFKTGFDEYNDKWFTGQKVLRGGSFGTPAMSIRGSYRNFFRLDERWMFAGFRCAQDA